MSAASILQVTHDAPRADDWNTLVWTPADRTRTGRQLIILNEINWMGMQDTTFPRQTEERVGYALRENSTAHPDSLGLCEQLDRAQHSATTPASCAAYHST